MNSISRLVTSITLCVGTMAFADAPFIDKPIFAGPGVGLGATVTNVSLDSIYGKILQYNFQYLAINELEAIENRMSDRVFWEFHMGVGAYEPKMMYKVGFVGCKLNLSSGKISEARRLQARLGKLRGYVQLSGSRGLDPKALNARIERLEAQVNTYNQERVWKRVGIAFWVPIWGEYRQSASVIRVGNDVSKASYSDPILIDSAYQANKSSLGGGTSSALLYKDFSKSAVALTYDIGDLATLSLGINLKRSLFLGVSVDISTPGAEFVNSFRSEIKDNFRTSSAVPNLP